MNRMTDESLDQVYFELPIMRGEAEAVRLKLGMCRSALRCRLNRLKEEKLAVNIGTGWVSTADSWIQEGTDEQKT